MLKHKPNVHDVIHDVLDNVLVGASCALRGAELGGAVGFVCGLGRRVEEE